MQHRNDAQRPLWVTVGVDTHLDTHTAAAVDPTGRNLQWRTFPADAGGSAQLLACLKRCGAREIHHLAVPPADG